MQTICLHLQGLILKTIVANSAYLQYFHLAFLKTTVKNVDTTRVTSDYEELLPCWRPGELDQHRNGIVDVPRVHPESRLSIPSGQLPRVVARMRWRIELRVHVLAPSLKANGMLNRSS